MDWRDSWCVLTSFGRVGTVGMERGYSWSFVPFQPVFRCLCPFQLQKEKAGIAANSVRSVTFWTVNIKHSVQLIVTHRLQVGCLEHTHEPLPPLLFPFSRHDYSAAKTHAVLSGGEGGSGPRQGSSSRGGGGRPARRASSVFVATFVCPGSMSHCGGLVSMLKSLSLFLPESIASIRLCVC